eukprot:SAG31_NODE_37425_length_304_cov_0.985366_1_plen_64_part_01
MREFMFSAAQLHSPLRCMLVGWYLAQWFFILRYAFEELLEQETFCQPFFFGGGHSTLPLTGSYD